MPARVAAVRVRSCLRRWLAGGCVLAVALGGCRGGRDRELPAPEVGLEVAFSGCYEFVPERTCVLAPDRELTLWVRVLPGTGVELAAGGRPLEPRPRRPVQTGTRFELILPDGAAELVVRARRGPSSSSWRLPLRPYDEPPLLREADELFASIPAIRTPDRAERIAAIRTRLEETLRSLPFERRGRVLWQLSGWAESEGNLELKERLLRWALAADRAGGRLRGLTRAATALHDGLYRQHRVEEARRVLDELPADLMEPGENAALVAYFQGRLALNTGDLRSALRYLERASRSAERLDFDPGLELAIAQIRGRALRYSGRDREADALFRGLAQRAPESGLRACARARLENNLGWDALLVLQAGRTADPSRWLGRALESFRECRVLPREIPNVRTNLALAHLLQGDLESARGQLEEARASGADPTPLLRVWWLDLEARLALAEGRSEDALALYRSMEEWAFFPAARWRSAVGEAGVLAELGRRSEALAAYERAERRLDGESLRVPLGEDRHRFLSSRELATRSYLELLADEPERAFAVARRGRARVLRAFDREGRLAELSPAEQRRWDRARAGLAVLAKAVENERAESWRLPQGGPGNRRSREEELEERLRWIVDELFAVLYEGAELDEQMPPPRPGEVVLAYHPLPSGWVGFAADGEGVASHRFAADDLAAAAEGRDPGADLLAPFRERILRAGKVRILAYGALRRLDFHALPFAGDVLLAARPVVYGLDLPARQRPPPAAATPARALVVADPTGELPAARSEAEAVVRILRRQDVAVVRLTGREATPAALRARLAEVELLHFAGHGEYATGGWESALTLAGRARLTAGAILTLKAAPALVVLSGCETARPSWRAPAESADAVAHAFLIAGAAAAVAALRPIDDGTTAELMADFYRRRPGASSTAEALRQAQLELRGRQPAADWASFRLIEP